MNFKVNFQEKSNTFTPIFHEVGSYTPATDYEGDYDISPKFEDQTLPTKNKTLNADILVNAIKVSRVSNSTGGKTIYIGGLING